MAPKGFVIDRHELTLYGMCDDCSAKTVPRGRKSADDRRVPVARSTARQVGALGGAGVRWEYSRRGALQGTLWNVTGKSC
ncbi:MAG: hypothetical protein JWR40_1023 [Massilia sp.]|jgi:hypothetical protein|nr:hypothetical protein [Massilia sp.]MDB5950739.1 hypothetical protein [Massilia sp.]